jgi:hypothetical protein
MLRRRWLGSLLLRIALCLRVELLLSPTAVLLLLLLHRQCSQTMGRLLRLVRIPPRFPRFCFQRLPLHSYLHHLPRLLTLHRLRALRRLCF